MHFDQFINEGELVHWYRKGVRTRLWDSGLPLIRVKFNTEIFFTFMPNVESERDNYQITMTATKRLYEAVMQLMMPKVIRKMPNNGFTKVMNTANSAC